MFCGWSFQPSARRFANSKLRPDNGPILTAMRLFRCHRFRSDGSPALHSAADSKRSQTPRSAPPFLTRRVGFIMRSGISTRYAPITQALRERLRNNPWFFLPLSYSLARLLSASGINCPVQCASAAFYRCCRAHRLSPTVLAQQT